jgi:Ca2+-binding EF-hand superfamily protein
VSGVQVSNSSKMSASVADNNNNGEEKKLSRKQKAEQQAQALKSRLANLHEVFTSLERLGGEDAGGEITVEKLGIVLREHGHIPAEEDIVEMVKAVDITRTGSLEFKEFVGLMDNDGFKPGAENADLEDNKLVARDNLRHVFKAMDHDGDDYISFADLKQCVEDHLEEDLTDQELNAWIASVGLKPQRRINFDAFATLMTQHFDDEEDEDLEEQ